MGRVIRVTTRSLAVIARPYYSPRQSCLKGARRPLNNEIAALISRAISRARVGADGLARTVRCTNS